MTTTTILSLTRDKWVIARVSAGRYTGHRHQVLSDQGFQLVSNLVWHPELALRSEAMLFVDAHVFGDPGESSFARLFIRTVEYLSQAFSGDGRSERKPHQLSRLLPCS